MKSIVRKAPFCLVLFAFLLFACEQTKTDDVTKEVSLADASAAGTSPAAAPALQYEPVPNGNPYPPEKSLDRVLLTEFIDFGCGYCYQFNSILPQLKNTFREKLVTDTYIVRWRGDDVVKAFYYAESQGRGDDFKNLMFRLFHESGIKNINNPDVLISVLNELKLIEGGKDQLDTILNSEAVIEKFNTGDEKARRFAVQSTPTVLIEEAVKVGWSQENLTGIITSLLK